MEEMQFRRENCIANLGTIRLKVEQDQEDPMTFAVSFSLTLPEKDKMAEHLALLAHTITEAIISFDETFEVKS